MLFPKDMIQIVLNQYQKGHPVSPEIVGKQLGKPVFASIPKDDQSCITSLNRSMPALVVAKNGAFARGVIECVRKIVQKNVLRSLEKIAKAKPAPKKDKVDKGGDGKAAGANPWLMLKSRIHKSLVEEMDLKKEDDNDPKALLILREKTKKVVVDMLNKEDTKGIVNGREELSLIHI